MDRIPKPGECYRHFKNKLYQIITVAENSETGERMVVYQALYGTFGTYVQPLAGFTGEVDHERYPQTKQKYRFEQVMLKAEADTGAEESEETGEAGTSECDEERHVSNENLLAFLEAETYGEKLEVLRERREIFTEDELAAVCEALDVGSGDGTGETMYRASANYLEMQSKYDGVRLR